MRKRNTQLIEDLASSNDKLELFPIISPETGKLAFLKIALIGSLSKLPSKSNGKRTFYNKKANRWVIVNDPESTNYFKKLTKHFNIYPRCPSTMFGKYSFFDEQVHLTLSASKANDRADRDNLLKGICDWLQQVGIVNNDNQIQPFPFRQSDYPELAPGGATYIYIQPISLLHDRLREFITATTIPQINNDIPKCTAGA